MTNLTMNTHDQAIALASRLWDQPHEALHAEEHTTLYPWMKRHILYQVSCPPAHPPAKIAIHRHGQDSLLFQYRNLEENLPLLNQLFQREGLALPEALAPEVMAEAIRAFMWDHSGFVATEALWEHQQPNLRFWVSPLGQQGEEIFKSYCQNPPVKINADRWELRFYFFNARGGVEFWTARGNASTVEEATFKPILADGTFFYPYA